MLPNLAGLALRGNGDKGEEEEVSTAVDTKGAGIGKVRLKPLKKRIELPSLKLPDGTVNAPCGSDPECARVVAVRPAVVEAVRKLFANTSPAALAQGRDLRDDTGAPYKSLRVQAVFEIEYGESNASYKAYIAKKAAMLMSQKKCDDYGAKEECTRTKVALAPAVKDLMQMGPLAEGVNETFLLHGSFPSALLAIMQAGFKTDMSQVGRQAYGAGIYQAEDVGKADQYASSQNSGQLDVALGLKTEEDVRAQMLGGSTKPITFYMLVTRTLLGCATHMADNESGRDNSSKRGLNDALAFEEWAWQDAKGEWHREHRIAPPYNSIIKEHSDTLRGRAQWKPQRYREFLVQGNDQVLPVMIVAYTRDPAPIEPPYDPRVLHCDIWSPVADALRSGSAEARYRAAWQVRLALEEGAPGPKELRGANTYWYYDEMYNAGIVEALAKVATERVTREGWTQEYADLMREKEALMALSEWSASVALLRQEGRHTVRTLLKVYAPLDLNLWVIFDHFAAMLDQLMSSGRILAISRGENAALLLELLATLVQDHDDETRQAMLSKVGMPRLLRAWVVSESGGFVWSPAVMRNAIALVGGLLQNEHDSLDDAVVEQFLEWKGVQGLIAIIKYQSASGAPPPSAMPRHPPIAGKALNLLGLLVSEGMSGGSLACADLQETLFDLKWTPLVDPRPSETLKDALVRCAWEYPRENTRQTHGIQLQDMARAANRLIEWGISAKPLDSAAMCGALKLHLLKELSNNPEVKAVARIRWFRESEGVTIPLRVLNQSRMERHRPDMTNHRPPPTLKPEWFVASTNALELLAMLFDWNVPQWQWQKDEVIADIILLRSAATEKNYVLIRNLVDMTTVQTKNQLMDYRRWQAKDHGAIARSLLHHIAGWPGKALRETVRKELNMAQQAGHAFPDDTISYVLHGEGL